MTKQEQIFVEAVIKTDKNWLTNEEIAQIRSKGAKFIIDGEFWFKVCKEYEKNMKEKQEG